MFGSWRTVWERHFFIGFTMPRVKRITKKKKTKKRRRRLAVPPAKRQDPSGRPIAVRKRKKKKKKKRVTPRVAPRPYVPPEAAEGLSSSQLKEYARQKLKETPQQALRRERRRPPSHRKYTLTVGLGPTRTVTRTLRNRCPRGTMRRRVTLPVGRCTAGSSRIEKRYRQGLRIVPIRQAGRRRALQRKLPPAPPRPRRAPRPPPQVVRKRPKKRRRKVYPAATRRSTRLRK